MLICDPSAEEAARITAPLDSLVIAPSIHAFRENRGLMSLQQSKLNLKTQTSIAAPNHGADPGRYSEDPPE